MPFYFPNNPENQNFEKLKKTRRGIIILNMSAINENHMMIVPEIWSTTDRIFSHFRPLFALLRHGVKVGPGPQDLEPQAPATRNPGPH